MRPRHDATGTGAGGRMGAGAQETHLSALIVDALVAERLDGGARAQAEAHLDGCARCRGDVDSARAAQAEFAEVVLPRTLARVRSRLSSAPRGWRARLRSPWVWVAGAATAAAALLLVIGVRPHAVLDGDLMTKGGGPSLRVVGRRDGHVFAVADGARLRAGDELRFVVSGDAPWLLVGSIDGDGQASIYYPFDGAASAAIDARGKRLELPGSIVLDGARGPERIFALFSDTPLPAARVRQELARIGAGGPDAIRATHALPDEPARQLTIVVEKDAR